MRNSHAWILILDFGSQYTQLIARRFRELNIYCEIHPYNHGLNEFEDHPPKGVVLSGGPMSVNDEGAPYLDTGIYDWNVPVLGVCYGLQIIAHTIQKGSVERSNKREFGRASLIKNEDNALFNIWDVGRQRLTNLNITESITKSAFISTSEVFFEDLEMVKKIFYLDDSLIIFEPELYRFSIKNSSTNEIINIPYNTSGLSFYIPEKNEYFIFTSALTVNPSLKRIAAAPVLLGQIDFFEINGCNTFSTIFERAKNLQ